MAGFLDRGTRILDMVLTNQGKDLLSRGELNFCYWVPFDEGVDYDPVLMNSSSLTTDQLSASIYSSIESAPVREAVTGYRSLNASGRDETNVSRPLFTMAQGQKVLPRTEFPPESDRQVEVKQRKVQKLLVSMDKNGHYVNKLEPVDVGIERISPTSFPLTIRYTRDSFPSGFQPEGFFLRVFKSGSDGYSELKPRRDMTNELAYSNDVRLTTSTRDD